MFLLVFCNINRHNCPFYRAAYRLLLEAEAILIGQQTWRFAATVLEVPTTGHEQLPTVLCQSQDVIQILVIFVDLVSSFVTSSMLIGLNVQIIHIFKFHFISLFI